jgi:hypothetical protein
MNNLMNFLSIVEYTKDFYGENFGYVLMIMRICCGLVGVDSKTLVHFVLFHFIFFCYSQNSELG